MFIIVGKKYVCVLIDRIHLSVMNCCCSLSFGEKKKHSISQASFIILILVLCLVAIVLTQSYST